MPKLTKYRPHRELLDESMREVIEIATLDELVRHMRGSVQDWYPPDLLPTIENVAVKPYTYDDRIGWNTYIVTVNGQAWGFTDGPL